MTADQLPADDPNRLAMRIAPRTMLCANAWRIGGTVADAGFDELRELTAAAGDKVSLAIGMAGFLAALTFNDRIARSSVTGRRNVADTRRVDRRSGADGQHAAGSR